MIGISAEIEGDMLGRHHSMIGISGLVEICTQAVILGERHSSLERYMHIGHHQSVIGIAILGEICILAVILGKKIEIKNKK